ncbi:hypothetical protein NSPZN2_10035 [Nitrospira defluvii]|uniref:Peptidase S8/S53 domain-containing protein n=1 Tax=Nitrospira defluvii TaxID=330214 RepID=A0ABM8QB22_9BACT|nr:hypothetical protein NSPZN2_10035 [Nitrospira defluvii]
MAASGSFWLAFLQSIDHVRVGLIDTGDGVNPRQYQLGQGVLMRNFNDCEDVRLAPAGVDLFDLFDVRQGFHDVGGLSGMDVDQDVGSVGHRGESPLN